MRHIQHRAFSFILHFPLLLCLLAAPAFAQTQVMMRLSSGTGFVVNREGYVITNEHVVRGCERITVTTPEGEQPANLVATDAKQDLAALRIAGATTAAIAPLRWNIKDLKVGDGVVLMGFPGEAGIAGHYQFRKSQVLALTGPGGEQKWIQIASVAEHGNSGGPVLDGAGNVIAVIAANALMYRMDDRGRPVGEALNKVDVAITLDALKSFMDYNRIPSYGAASGSMPYADQALETHARKFIVPIRCYQGRI